MKKSVHCISTFAQTFFDYDEMKLIFNEKRLHREPFALVLAQRHTTLQARVIGI